MKTKADPTGQARNRSRGERALRSRLTVGHGQVMRLFKAIPKIRRVKADIQNASESTTVYDYEVSARETLALAAGVQFILNSALLESQDVPPPNWYWRTIIERPYAQGTAEEVIIFNQLINQAGIKAQKGVEL